MSPYMIAMTTVRDGVQALVNWYRDEKGMQRGQCRANVGDPLGHGTSIMVNISWFSAADAKRIEELAERKEGGEVEELAKEGREESLKDETWKSQLMFSFVKAESERGNEKAREILEVLKR